MNENCEQVLHLSCARQSSDHESRPLPSPYVGCAGEGVRWEWLKQLTPTEIQQPQIQLIMHADYAHILNFSSHYISSYNAYIHPYSAQGD